MPRNPITETIQYNKRFLISYNQTNPIAWEVSKIEDTYPDGLIFITLKQDLFDPKKDNKELMIADYYTDLIPPSEEVQQDLIHYSGKPEVKVGGGYKTFSVENWRGDYSWSITGLEDSWYTTILKDNSIKIKIIPDYTLIGKTFTLSLLQSEKEISQLEVGVVSL